MLHGSGVGGSSSSSGTSALLAGPTGWLLPGTLSPSSSSAAQFGYFALDFAARIGLSGLPLRGRKQAPGPWEPSRSGPHGAMWQSEASHAGWLPPQPKARCAAAFVNSLQNL